MTENEITEFLLESNWISRLDSIEFLASGEYNENYLVAADDQMYVFRVNHGSQLEIEDQIAYEYSALAAVEESGRTPKPHNYASATSERPGVLLEEFIDGSPFIYEEDSLKAAETFSRIHRVNINQRAPLQLINQECMIDAIVDESEAMRRKYKEHPRKKERIKIEKYHEEIRRRTPEWNQEFDREIPCIVNSEVNSGNFVVREGIALLVDWEKAVISYRYQDLGHFVVPTTTLWKSDFYFTPESRAAFLSTYINFTEIAISLRDLSYLTSIMERVILLRALSWCYMAFYEYTRTDRHLQNDTTFMRITAYLDEIDRFLDRPD